MGLLLLEHQNRNGIDIGGHMPVCFDYKAHSIDDFVHSGGRATITKFVIKIDTTTLKFCKPVVNNRLVWYNEYNE
ncbi:hypothetical protein EVAR_54698_1 [Eumeta japonica]|uniref:Uncharacterized protein n=1 Tax=Eumeta variegata TaxID=151549 RepID=A0A4C1X7P5_EUMVA|nr:hypothetical protein EVAR_54698_1 [Eumeta japonica]